MGEPSLGALAWDKERLMGRPALQALSGETRAGLEGRAGQGPSALGSALSFTTAAGRREPLSPAEPPRAQRVQLCLELTLPALKMASAQLMAPVIPQPLPPMPCAPPIPPGAPPCQPSCTLAQTLGKCFTCNSLQPGRDLCAVTLAGLASRCVHVLSLPSDTSRADRALFILTHTHTPAPGTLLHPQQELAVKNTHFGIKQA